MQRLLFFVEPVVFRDNPVLLSNWIEKINAAARCSVGKFEIHLASSKRLCEFACPDTVRCWPLPSFSVLEVFGFDRTAYMQDLCLGNGRKNDALLGHLQKVHDRVQPDVVISWTENAYLKRVFRGAILLFAEIGAMPRTGFKTAIHLDPCGHQVSSVFEFFRTPRWTTTDEDWPVAAWERHWLRSIDHAALKSGIADWCRSLPRSQHRKLVALQPEDWLTYEGCGVAVPSTELLARIAAASDPEDLIIPQWHPSQSPPPQCLLDSLQQEYPNLAIPPEHLRVGHSELLLPVVDEVVTISSNVALAAALFGRRVSVLGRSKFEALSTPPGEPARKRSDLVSLLAADLCRPIEFWTFEQGGFVEHVTASMQWRSTIETRSELTISQVRRFLDRDFLEERPVAA